MPGFRGVAVAFALVMLAGCQAPVATPAPPGAGSGAPVTQPPGPPPTAGASPSRATPAASGQGGPTLPAGASWAPIDLAGPAPEPREDHTWTVDAEGRIAYLFGGRAGGTDFGDLWAFDLAAQTWTELEPTVAGPDARFGHDAVWVPGRGLVVALGQAGAGFFDDIWLFEPATTAWRELPGAGARPVARYGSCSGVGPDGRLWISHGFTEDGTRFFDTRAYDFAALSWTDESGGDAHPIERCLHTCWWSGDGTFALYGGQTTGVAALGDLWFLTPGSGDAANTWRQVDDPGPPARQLAAVARRGPLTVMFGGRDIDRSPLQDTWLRLDGGDAKFAPYAMDGPAPPARSGAAMVYDPGRDRLLLFGGIAETPFDDLWALPVD